MPSNLAAPYKFKSLVLDPLCCIGVCRAPPSRVQTKKRNLPGPFKSAPGPFKAYCSLLRQPIVTMSSTEAELVALTDLTLQEKWIQHLLNHGLQLSFKTTQVICDNKSTVTLAMDPIPSDRTKHIEVRLRMVQELVESKKIEVTWVTTVVGNAR
jgi:hypothetical protein